LDERDFAKFRVYKRDVLFNRTNSYELVGKTAIFDIEGDFVFASYLIRVVPNAAQLLPECLNYYLNWDDAQRRLKMLATRGVSQSNISATKLKQFAIGLPSLVEQAEIARTLSVADRKIEAEEQRKAALQALFKAMLHQLMTGQIRMNAGADSHCMPL
jgi:type I restriction enzyme S subunit